MLGILGIAGCCFQTEFRRQSTRPLTYYIHSGINSDWFTHIRRAADTWNGTYSMFTYGGVTGASGYVNDGVNSIFMTRFQNPATLARVQFPSWGGCTLYETDMGWSDQHSWGTDTIIGRYDVETVALHEFGHYGILLHVRCPSGAVMLPTYQGLLRSRHFCDGLGMWVVNVLPACIPATGVCFPSFFSQVAFNDTDDEESSTANTMQENVDELIQIWDGDGTLRSNADSLGDFYSRVLDDWRNGGSWAYSEVFTSARYNDMDAQIISRVYASASGALRADLDNLRGVLQSKIQSEVRVG